MKAHLYALAKQEVDETLRKEIHNLQLALNGENTMNFIQRAVHAIFEKNTT